MKVTIDNYEKQATDFLFKTGTHFRTKYIKHDFYFNDDKKKRDIYECTLSNSKHTYTFKFGQSIVNSSKNISPSSYDVLSCLTKYDVGSFEEFCSDFGYDVHNSDGEVSRKSIKIYNAVVDEYENIKQLFTEKEIEELSEIN